MAKAKPTKKKTGKTSKTSKGKGKGKGKGDEGAYGLPSDEELEKEAQAIDEQKKESSGEDLHIGQLQKMSIPQLHELAQEEGVLENSGLKKHDLMCKIHKERT
ncbi:MAG: Rho termination factor N-terminal domain-containing protein, partial [Planctomycetes bacterium]|nr:Rho termination factor N-terminal domain-containing protein [Planctomycetota bacterium]